VAPLVTLLKRRPQRLVVSASVKVRFPLGPPGPTLPSRPATPVGEHDEFVWRWLPPCRHFEGAGPDIGIARLGASGDRSCSKH